MSDARKTNVESAQARGNIYGLLTRVFRAEPDTEFIRELKGSELAEVFSALDVDLGSDFQNLPEAGLREELAIEFTRLFLGPGTHISAHESIFVEVDGDSGGLWGKGTVAVKKFIESTGLAYDDDFTGLPDHISVELEFMQRLTDWEAELWEKGEDEHAQHCLGLQKMFAEQHLLKWVPEFCSRVIDAAELPFYREIAKMTVDFLEFERQSIATDAAAPEARI